MSPDSQDDERISFLFLVTLSFSEVEHNSTFAGIPKKIPAGTVRSPAGI
jgi:hypothetical protein